MQIEKLSQDGPELDFSEFDADHLWYVYENSHGQGYGGVLWCKGSLYGYQSLAHYPYGGVDLSPDTAADMDLIHALYFVVCGNEEHRELFSAALDKRLRGES